MKNCVHVLITILGVMFLESGIIWGQATEAQLMAVKISEWHSSTVNLLAISPDERFVATCSQDNTIKLWDISSGKEMRTFIGHSGPVFSVTFSPDGKFILSGSRDRTIKLWECATGRIVRTYKGHDGYVLSVVFLPDGRSFLSGADDNQIKMWNTDNGQEIRTFSGHTDSIKSIAFSSDAKYIFSGSSDRTLRIWETATGKHLKTLLMKDALFGDMVISPTSTQVLSCTGLLENGFVTLWDIQDGRELVTFSFKAGVVALAFSRDGRSGLCGNTDGTINLLDLVNGKKVRSFQSASAICTVSFSADGESIFSCGIDSVVTVWDISSGSIKTCFANKVEWVNSVSFSPDTHFIATGSEDKTVKIWERITARLHQTIKVLAREEGWGINTISYSPDGSNILAGSENTLHLINVSNGKGIKTFEGDVGKFPYIAFAPDGTRAVSGSWIKDLKIWNVNDGKEVAALKGHTEQIWCVAYSPDGKSALSGAGDNTIVLWDITKKAKSKSFIGHKDYVKSVAFSPDGKRVVSGSSDKTLKFWDVQSGKLLRTLRGHVSDVTSLSYSADGNFLTSVSKDGTMRLWSVSDLSCVYTALANADGSQWLVYTSDGYWDGSPNCGSLVAMVRGMDVWNIDQFAARNNRPDILAERAGAAPEVVAEFKAAWKKRLKKTGLIETGLTSDYRVPIVVINSSKQDTAQNGKFVDLTLSFSANGKQLKAYQVYVNGVPLFGSIGKPLSGEKVELSERIELVEGDNKIEVGCMDSGGAESFRANQVIRWSGDVRPNLYFLAFGISDYADPGIRPLKYAAQDAISLEEVYKKMAGGTFSQVFTKVVTNRAVTKQAIINAKEFLKGDRPDDTFVLFISGHGVQIGDVAGLTDGKGKGLSVNGAGSSTNGPNNSGSTYYYVTADAKLNDIAGTAADFDLIEDLPQGIAPRQKLFLMDTCQSGENDDSSPMIALSGTGKGLYARTLSPENRRGLNLLPTAAAKVSAQRDRWIYNDLTRRSGAIVFSSCRGNEASLEADQWEQGAFTYEILQAYKDKAADTNKDGMISTDELRAYVAENVPKLVHQIASDAQQHPTVDRDNIYMKFGFPILSKP